MRMNESEETHLALSEYMNLLFSMCHRPDAPLGRRLEVYRPLRNRHICRPLSVLASLAFRDHSSTHCRIQITIALSLLDVSYTALF